MTNIFRSLSFTITQAVYSIIPDIYNVFMDLASNRYFSEKSIKELSGNIYTIISVCMLFALGIKLLSAIVNPDLLDDKKKGAKKVFINCALSVFLIILIPIGFEKLYELQKDVVKNQLVEKLVLGMDTSEQSKPGQILAAYAFSSFCHPKDTVSSEKIANSGGNLYNKALQEDINLISKLDDVINSKTNGEYDIEYNTLISPIVGVVLDYQLILLCMDTALRTIKLGLLELIAPIVLCGFIFAGSDLLQRWFKEVISTFTLLFIKIGTVSFLVFGLSLLPDFLKNFSDKSIFYRGFLRVFMLIGLLQVIHILPDIIKKIFNVDVKLRGGIRGRLGEMAGVGKLAQGAWDKLKNAGLKIGAGAGLVAAAVGSGALPFAFSAGAGVLGAMGHHQWKKGFGNTRAWKDRGAGRVIRRFGSGAKGIWTGLSTKGGVGKSIEAAKKSYNESEIGMLDAATKKDGIISSIKKSFGIGEDGRITDVVRHIQNGDNYNATVEAIRKSKLLGNNIAKELKRNHISNDVVKLTQDYSLAAKDEAISSAISSKYNTIKDKVQSMIDNETNQATQDQLRDYLGQYLSQHMSSTELVAAIGSMTGMVSAANSINGDSEKLQRLLQTTISTGDNEGRTFMELLTGGTGRIKIGSLGDEVSAFKTTADSRKSDVDAAKNVYKLDDNQKAAIDKTMDSINVTAKTYASTQASEFVDESTV